MVTARVASVVSAAKISAAPRPREVKNAHSCETPRSFGLIAATASLAASLAAARFSVVAS